MSDSSFALPVVDESSNREWVAAGEYQATCIAIHPPSPYRRFQRMYRRADFTIHNDGVTVPAYVNVPQDKVSVRSNYYRYWVAAMGRRHQPGELLDLAVMLGKAFTVTVADKVHADGDAYSVVTDVRAMSLTATGSVLNTQNSVTQDSSTQDSSTQDSSTQDSSTQDSATQDSATQDTQATQGRRRPGLPPDVSALVLPRGDNRPDTMQAQGRE
jgi:hypothetical protein